MNWKKLVLWACLGLCVVGSSLPGYACDVAKGSGIMVKAPLDAINCGATPPTITVLGLNIDISKANFSSEGNGSLTCADLTVGQVVEVALASDNPVPSTGLLLASGVGMEDNGGSVVIAAPIQAVDTTDPNVPKVKVLGLVVDVSQAILKGNDDETLNISQLTAGQFAMMTLTSSQPPLSATMLWIQQVEMKVQAPIDAVNCGATPPTITVLGLNIDISKTSLYSDAEDSLTCADLTVGQVVRVTLASDIPDPTTNLLSATEVEEAEMRNYGCHDGNAGNVKIAAPLQAIDPNGTSVTVLGLVIDISNAFPRGDDNDKPVSLNQWMVGQFAMLTLASNQPPLSATMLLVHRVEMKVRAPLDAINCGATPPTITVLGLNIDISKTNLYSDYACGLTCVGLTAGQAVEVTLASDIPDSTTNLLSATRVEMEKGGWYEENGSDVKIAAPIQAMGSNGTSVTVLGLVIDISNTILELNNGLPINASQLTSGQFVNLTLASNQPPLSAVILAAQNSSVQATVQVLDNKGKPVNDGAVNDISLQVTIGQGKKARAFNFLGNGKFYLSGLPAGKAMIVVTRVRNGQKSMGSSSFTVKANKPKNLLIRLKPTRK